LAKLAGDLAIEWRMDGPLVEKLLPFLSGSAPTQNTA